MRAVGTTLGWGYVRLWLVDAVTDALRLVATFTAPGERPPPIPVIRRGDGLAGRCWERGELLWVPDIHAEGAPIMPEVAANAAFRAAGAVPVRNGDQTIGVLTFFSHSPQEPEPVLAMLLSGIAGNIGAYLEQRRSEELAVHLAAATDEYIALVGHELRTPLTSIGTYTQLIAESPDDTPIGSVRGLLEVVERNNAALRHLVEQLLALAALEAGHVTLALTDVDLAATVAEAVASAAGERGIGIRADLPAHLVVPGDRPRLRQVVANLLDNAITFSPDGATVTVTLATDGDAAVLTVADAGTGIPDGDRANVFRRLYRGSNARHTGIPGHGLGLAFCRSVVERHHGTITLAAGDPVGTTVTVRLPGSRRDS